MQGIKLLKSAAVMLFRIAAVVPANADFHLPDCRADADCFITNFSPIDWKTITPAELQAMIDAGAEANAKNEWGWTPLHSAALGRTGIISILLEAGADVSAIVDDGDTPLDEAETRGYCDVVRELGKAGAYIYATDNQGWASLQYAEMTGEVRSHSYPLVKAGEKPPKFPLPDCKSDAGYLVKLDDEGWKWVTAAEIKEMIDAGAYVNAADNQGRTPLDLAKIKEYWDAAKALEKARTK